MNLSLSLKLQVVKKLTSHNICESILQCTCTLRLCLKLKVWCFYKSQLCLNKSQ